VCLQKAPHLQDPKQNHSENDKSGNSKQEFFLEVETWNLKFHLPFSNFPAFLTNTVSQELLGQDKSHVIEVTLLDIVVV